MKKLREKLCTLHTVKLVLAATLFIFIALYSSSLLAGNNDGNVHQNLSPSPASERLNLLPNRVHLSPRSTSLPPTGVNICPAEFSEYIPCHDPKFIRSLRLNVSRREHLERHCRPALERPFCLVPPPRGYKLPIRWPQSRDFVWRSNVNHTLLAEVKGGQNWVHVNGSRMWFPGGGTHFKHGAPEYIQRLGNMTTDWKGDLKSAGVTQMLDVGCGVASFAAYLFPLNINTVSFAPLDVHENQIQFALERGIPALVAVLGTKRLPYPSNSFDAVHCSRCRVDWHEHGGVLLREMDRLLRPGGFFIYSAPPAYRKDKDFPLVWELVTSITASMCWRLISQHVQTAIWKKTRDGACQLDQKYLCSSSMDLDNLLDKPLDNCIASSTSEAYELRNNLDWPDRLTKFSKKVEAAGVSSASFDEDTKAWERTVGEYWELLNVSSDSIRNVMDMNALNGGFAVALRDKPVWVMNVVPPESVQSLKVVYARGLIGTFHNWCESFSSYPRSYDLLHAYQVVSSYNNKGRGCETMDLMLEMDRLLRPNGIVIFQDKPSVIQEVQQLASKFIWSSELHSPELMICRKRFWVLEEASG